MARDRFCTVPKCSSEAQLSNVFVKMPTGSKTVNCLLHSLDMTTCEFMHALEDKIGIPVDEQRLIFAGKPFPTCATKNVTMRDMKVQNMSTLFLVLRLRGGADTEPASKAYTGNEHSIKFTKAADTILGEDDPNRLRATMSCGHAVDPEALTAYTRSLVDQRRYELTCPALTSPPSEARVTFCGQIWPYEEVRRLAMLTFDEQRHFETAMSESAAMIEMGAKKCPQCAAWIIRENSTGLLISCSQCARDRGRAFAFCWNCLLSWKNKGTAEDCGNEQCQELIEKALQECPTKDLSAELVGVPIRRACIRCGLVIEHEAQCKHMNCPRCEQSFCFACLRPLQGANKCDTRPYSKCSIPIADKQTEIPHWSGATKWKHNL